MAVTQVAQIQIRRGLEQDIGNLASGELAWAIDTQKLYIGNGLISEGAPVEGRTELLTAGAFTTTEMLGNYTFNGQAGGYVVVTGINENNPVVRSFQDKSDDFVNIKDFGATGSGNSDDSDAIQRAITAIYSRRATNTDIKTRRGIKFSPGTYLITKDIEIPPYAILVGDGLGSVTIKQTGGDATCVFKFVTSVGGDPADPLQDQYLHPTLIRLSGFTLYAERDIDILKADSISDVICNDVALQGPRVAPTNLGIGTCISLTSKTRSSSKITFTNCKFSGLSYAAYIDSTVGTGDICFIYCNFSDLYAGIYTSQSETTPSGIKVTNSTFKDIATQAIYGDVGVSGITSIGNTYTNIGNNQAGDSSPASPVLVFQADNNFSIGDTFSRTVAQSQIFPRIDAHGYGVLSTALDDAFYIGNSRTTSGKQIIIPNGSSDSVVLPNFTYGQMNYSIVRGNNTRFGVIKIAGNGIGGQEGTLHYEDEYTETNDIGCNLMISNLGAELLLSWSTLDQGTNIRLTFDTKTLQ